MALSETGKKYAQELFNAATRKLLDEHQGEIKAIRAKAASQGNLFSGAQVRLINAASARYGAALLQATVDSSLAAYSESGQLDVAAFNDVYNQLEQQYLNLKT